MKCEHQSHTADSPAAASSIVRFRLNGEVVTRHACLQHGNARSFGCGNAAPEDPAEPPLADVSDAEALFDDEVEPGDGEGP